jgi:hypothetical protein
MGPSTVRIVLPRTKTYPSHYFTIQKKIRIVPGTQENLHKNCNSNRMQIWVVENGAIEVVFKLAPIVFRPLATEGLHFKNYQLLIMRILKKNYWNSPSSMGTRSKIVFFTLNSCRPFRFLFYFLALVLVLGISN